MDVRDSAPNIRREIVAVVSGFRPIVMRPRARSSENE